MSESSTIVTDSALALVRHDFVNRLADDIRSGKLTEYRKDVLVHCIVDGLRLMGDWKDSERLDGLERLVQGGAVTLAHYPEAEHPFSVIARTIHDAPSLREAVDAALSKVSAGETETRT